MWCVSWLTHHKLKDVNQGCEHHRSSHKAYVIEPVCRALYTLVHRELSSKPRAVQRALDTLPGPWHSTVAFYGGTLPQWRTAPPRIPPSTPRCVHLCCGWRT